MKLEELKNKINSIMDHQQAFGLNVYALLNDGNDMSMRKFSVDDKLREELRKMIESVVDKQYINCEHEIESADNISDDRKILYQIIQDEDYCPFEILNQNDNNLKHYSEEDQNSIMGLLFRVNLNDEFIWFYQHIYQVRMIKRSRSLYAMLNEGNTYVQLDRDIFKIDSRIDILILKESILFSNASLLQQSFGFDKYIRCEASKTIQFIEELDIVTNVDKIVEFEDKPKLTNSKKLMKAKTSPVLKMNKKDLIRGLKKHSRYKDKFKFEKDKIVINSQKDVGELIKMLNDNIVRSELTNQEYDSPVKHILEPLQ